jgi:hypothetical protein
MKAAVKMRPFTNVLMESFRHLAVGVAVVLVLMMTLPVHFHVQTDHGHGHEHTAEWSVGLDLDEASGPPHRDVGDPDGCGYCHCPATSLLIPDVPLVALHDQASGLTVFSHPAAAPDSVSYAPDPPPVLLS